MLSNYQTNKTIPFQVLSQDQREEVNTAVLEVLANIGVIVNDSEARALLQRGGAFIDNTKAYLPKSLVQKALSSAPRGFSLYHQNEEKWIKVEGKNVYFGPGPSNTYTIDPYTGKRRHPVKSDTANAAKVIDALENIDFAMDFGTIRDVPTPYADVHLLQALLKNTTKPICHWAYTTKNLETMIKMCEEIAGSMEELQRQPFISFFATSNTPLMHSKEALQKLLFIAKNQLPFFYVSAPMAGATAPITQAGALVLCLAECLSGLVIHQLENEGAPFAIGGVPSACDMRTLLMSYGSPEFNVMHACFAEMARYYHLPMWGTAGCSDAKDVDQQAAIESTASIMMSAMSGANFIHDVGYIEGGSTSSLAQLVMGDEIIGMVKKMIEGIEISERTLALDVIKEVGPQGQFVSHKHTFDNLKELWAPTIMDRSNHQEWTEKGGLSLGDRAKDKARFLIENHKPAPVLSKETEKKIEKIIEERCQ